jgi:hypothetical protein
MASYFGYGKELLYYANNIGVKPVALFDHMIENKELYPVTNELVDSYVKNYTDNMFDTEEELYKFVKDNLKKLSDDQESLVRLSKARGLLVYIVKYILRDPNKTYLREIKHAICNIKNEKEVVEDTDFILNLALSLMIDPFKDTFVPDVEIESKFDLYGWISEGYTKPLRDYEYDEKKKILLRCRNSVTVSETIKKDKEANRTDCYHFFRYMNSSLMRRYIDKDVSNVSPWEPFRREHRTVSIKPESKKGIT